MQKIIRNLNGTDSVETNQKSYNGSFTYFEGQSFQNQIEKKKTPFTVSKLKIVILYILVY